MNLSHTTTSVESLTIVGRANLLRKEAHRENENQEATDKLQGQVERVHGGVERLL